MKIVIISEYATRELYVIEKIIKEYPSTTVVRPLYPKLIKKRFTSVRTKIKDVANGIAWKIHRKLWDRIFYPDNNFPKISNIVEIPGQELHKPSGIEAINVLSPDILITCRSPLLKSGLIHLPKKAAVNIHFGIPPNYRGNETIFWPLYYNDFTHLGGCIHHLTEGVDTGNIVAEVYPSLTPWDGEISLDYKISRLLANATLTFLKAAEKDNIDLSGKPQPEKGRNFKQSERTFKKSFEYLFKRVIGLSRPPRRDERIITHFSSPAENNSSSSGRPLDYSPSALA